jgi:hypothetical protein
MIDARRSSRKRSKAATVRERGRGGDNSAMAADRPPAQESLIESKRPRGVTGAVSLPRGGDRQAVATRARPRASCASFAQSTLQPRASRPAIGAKWNHAEMPSLLPRSRRQPQDVHVTGPPAVSRREIPLESNTGYVIGLSFPLLPADEQGPSFADRVVMQAKRLHAAPIA